MECPECGANIRDDAKFCSECGHVVGAASSQVTLSQASPQYAREEPESDVGKIGNNEEPSPQEAGVLDSSLSMAVCQVGYEGGAPISDSRVMLAVQGELGGNKGPYPRIEKQQGSEPSAVLGGGIQTPVPAAPIGWRFLSPGGRWIISLMPDSFSLETRGNMVWEDFQNRFSMLIEAVAKHVEPLMEERLGLRYVYQIAGLDVKSPQEWRGHLAPELLGMALDEHLGPAILSAEQAIILDAGQGRQCTIRHGFAPDPARSNMLTYLIDVDTYRQGLRVLDASDIKASANAYDSWAQQVMRWVITA
jgi:uncharacterized protein (TIGR04255 family)